MGVNEVFEVNETKNSYSEVADFKLPTFKELLEKTSNTTNTTNTTISSDSSNTL